MNAQEIKEEIERRIPKAETGEQWADICALEAQLVEMEETACPIHGDLGGINYCPRC